MEIQYKTLEQPEENNGTKTRARGENLKDSNRMKRRKGGREERERREKKYKERTKKKIWKQIQRLQPSKQMDQIKIPTINACCLHKTHLKHKWWKGKTRKEKTENLSNNTQTTRKLVELYYQQTKQVLKDES